MTKLDILRLDSTTENDTAATLNINTNFENIQKAIENTLSRDGTAPNYMDADLDMNSYRIINVGTAVDDTDAVNYKQFKEEIGEATVAASQAAASAAQAATSAQSALVSSTNAINSVRGAENVLSYAQNLLSETQEYVDTAKADIAETASTNITSINKTVADAKQEINTAIDEAEMSLSDTITQATEDVKQQALEAAQGAINDAAAEATAIVVDYANNEIKPLLNEIASNAAESAENASESAGLAASESGNAAISATDSQHYAEDSRIWAEGSDSEVKNVDGEHSSKVWSEMAKTSATSASSSAELAKQYGNDKINQTHITNCITEIPQDIKLELNNGTLTLKAGSKVYVPNGSGVFDTVTTSADITNSQTLWGTGTYFVILRYGNDVQFIHTNTITSGNTEPTPTNGRWWYDTTNNKMKTANGTAWSDANSSFPIALVTSTNGTTASNIDQVFNGFGYIGSTVFALPNVKGLIPNGRNADGTLRNIECVFSKVVTVTNTSQYSGDIAITSDYFDLAQGAVYNEKDNKNYLPDGVTYYGRCLAGKFVKGANGVITSFQPKLPFRAADDQEVVKTSGNQTIGGGKTFTSSVILEQGQNDKLFFKDTRVDVSSSTGTDTFNSIIFRDKNNFNYANIAVQDEADGGKRLRLLVQNKLTDGTTKSEQIWIDVEKNGNVVTYAPTPATNSNSTNIATTAWFRNNMQVVSALPSSPTAGVFYFVKE